MDENWTRALREQLPGLPWLEMGSGFLIGLSVGYVVKKSFKLLLFLGGLAVILLFTLEHQHLITLNEEGLNQTVSEGSTLFQNFALFLKERLSRLGVAGGTSSVAGFFAGLKMG
jgi:uncharacterized membrane protein (Fun14 family)